MAFKERRMLSTTQNRLIKSVGMLALCLIVAMVYWPGMSGGFMFDDGPNITDNRTLGLFDGSLSSLFMAAGDGISSPLGRPLSMASFALNLHFGGLNPFGFKLVNLLIHLVNGWLVFLVVGQLWARLNRGGTGILPLGVALLWMLHPINLSAVLFVTQRMTSLAALFTLLALYFYLLGRLAENGRIRVLAYGLSFLVCWPLAVMAKESGLLFPLFALLCEFFDRRDVGRRISWQAIAGGLGLIALGALCGTSYFWDVVWSGYRFRDFNLGERLMTESRVLWFHLGQILFPSPDSFSLYHDDFPISRGLLQPPETMVSIFAWCLLIGVAVWVRLRWPILLFAIAWFLVGHALESSILPLEIMHEHRNYLASLGPLLAFFMLLCPQAKEDRAYLPRAVLLVCFTLYCGLVTGLRASQWGDEYRRATLEAAVHPDSARANYQAALIFIDRAAATGSLGNPMAYQAINYYLERSTELDKNAKAPLIGFLYMACQAGLPKDERRLLQLAERLRSARFSPGDLNFYKSLSGLLVENRLCLSDQQVQGLLASALENPLLDAYARGLVLSVGMDYAFAKMESLPLAMEYANRALSVDPSNVALRINLLHLLLKAGQHDRAVEVYAGLAKMKIPPIHLKEIIELKQLLGVDSHLAS